MCARANPRAFDSFRGIYEPHNYTRKIIRFDALEEFVVTSAEDRKADIIAEGAYSGTRATNSILTNF